MDVEARTEGGSKGHPSVVQYLCEQGAEKEARDIEYCKTELHVAVFHGRLSVVLYLCEQVYIAHTSHPYMNPLLCNKELQGEVRQS